MIKSLAMTNPNADIESKDWTGELSANELRPFLDMGIKNLLPCQAICFQFCTRTDLEGKFFI
jgi:hypothetical protein